MSPNPNISKHLTCSYTFFKIRYLKKPLQALSMYYVIHFFLFQQSTYKCLDTLWVFVDHLSHENSFEKKHLPFSFFFFMKSCFQMEKWAFCFKFYLVNLFQFLIACDFSALCFLMFKIKTFIIKHGQHFRKVL